jgi:Lrp/AsnC family leucine-responsive transcriptional regulator
MIKLDRMDKRILEELQKDGGISNLELAERVGLSPSPCSRRVKQLEDNGIIQGKNIRINSKALGFNLTAMIQVSMDRHTPDRFENFERKLIDCEEVQSCSLITGQSADYLVTVIVKDMEHFQEFLLGKLTTIEGVTGVHSSFVLRKIVDRISIALN